MDLLALAGRLMMSAILIESGVFKAMGPAGAIAMMTRYGLPLPELAWVVAVLIELVGGLVFLVGYKVRPVAVVLAVWCVATAVIAHLHPGDTNLMIHFMKNICMAGGFLQVAAFGAGRFRIGRN